MFGYYVDRGGGNQPRENRQAVAEFVRTRESFAGATEFSQISLRAGAAVFFTNPAHFHLRRIAWPDLATFD